MCANLPEGQKITAPWLSNGDLRAWLAIGVVIAQESELGHRVAATLPLGRAPCECVGEKDVQPAVFSRARRAFPTHPIEAFRGGAGSILPFGAIQCIQLGAQDAAMQCTQRVAAGLAWQRLEHA